MAGVEGFEPSQAVLETDVLPLTLYPYLFCSCYFKDIYNIITVYLFWQVVKEYFFIIFLFFIEFMQNSCYI